MKNFGTMTSFFVGGFSVGGYISQMLCFQSSFLEKHGISPTDITGFIHDAGQPTTHFRILSTSGEDSRRVIVDERAPLYYIGRDAAYPPMLIIVSDNDMTNRYEQTMLLISTLKHFGHEDKVTYKVMHGGHCHYVNKDDTDGKNIFGKMVAEYIAEITG